MRCTADQSTATAPRRGGSSETQFRQATRSLVPAGLRMISCAPRQALGGCSPNALHDDSIDRDIVETAFAARLDGGDLFDDVHAFGHPREYGVAEISPR